MTYFISDTHFDHANVIKYCNRPFKNVEDMNEVIINNWNSVVGKDDIIYHLGDFAFYIQDLCETVNRLNGKIFLIRGNHDRKTITYYNNSGLEIIPTQTKLDEYKIILSHRPLMDDQIPSGYINVHGHIHERYLQDIYPSESYSKEKHFNASADVIEFKPISVDKLLDIVTKRK